MSGVLRRIVRTAALIALGLGGLLVALIALYAVAPPVSTLMLGRWATFQPVDRQWRPLADISSHLQAAVVMSEDGQFCRHGGVDWKELNAVIDDADEGGPSRGASTIAMQTAKNLFLWPSRSVIRKAVEIPLAVALGAVWPKRRILEVYLNIAEWGEGTFGAQAAAQRHFHKDAKDLTPREAALLAAALPSPIRRDAGRPSRGHARLAGTVQARMAGAAEWLDCLRT